MKREEEESAMLKYPNAKYFDGARPWEGDIALPCATQNELNEDEQKHLWLMVVLYS
jgi:glutamate dehydrogenase (NADP+)